jgi:threonine synthase
MIGQAGIGCEPASASTLAGIQKLVKAGVMTRGDRVVAILTGSVMKDPDYIYRYHTGALKTPAGVPITGTYANQPQTVRNDATAITEMLSAL